MVSKYINPFTDFGFKRLFGEEENKDLLLDFLNELLLPQGVKIISLTYKNTSKIPRSAEDRKVIFDLFCENENGEKFTIEIQKAKQNNFKDRMLYYSSFSLQEQGLKGNWDYKLKSVYVIAILNFAFDSFVADKVIRYVQLLDIDNQEVFSDKLNYITIEMPNFNKTEEELETNLDKWLYLLRHLHELEKIPVKLQTKILEKAFKIAEYAAMPASEKQQYEESLKAFNDLSNALDTALEQGFQKASDLLVPKLEEALKKQEEALKNQEEAQKREQEALLTLKSMIVNLQNAGFDNAKIATMVGKTEEEIKNLLG